MPHEFEAFERPVVPIGNCPHITIQRRGTLSVNRAGYEALGKPRAVELLFDTKRRVLGLRPVDITAENAYQVRGAGKSLTSYLVAGTAFTKRHGIDTLVSRRWPAELDGNILFIDLTTESTQVTSNRRAPDA